MTKGIELFSWYKYFAGLVLVQAVCFIFACKDTKNISYLQILSQKIETFVQKCQFFREYGETRCPCRRIFRINRIAVAGV